MQDRRFVLALGAAALLLLGWQRTGLAADDYLVIDLKEGPAAKSYPVSHLQAPPEDGWPDEYKTTRLALRRISAGAFMMGSPPEECGRFKGEDQHAVTLTKDYYIGVFEVTQKQWELVMGAWPSFFTNVSYRDSRPVEMVSYLVIREDPSNKPISSNWPASDQVHPGSFMGKLRTKTGLTNLDLPTEAQWEYACRAGTTSALNSGKRLMSHTFCSNLAEVARYPGNCPSATETGPGGAPDMGTAKVGSYLPNQWGLYDMHGNVFEWCLDYNGTYMGAVTNPMGDPRGMRRVMRGGSCWAEGGRCCRSGYRAGFPADGTRNHIGFRVAMTMP